MTRMWRTDTYCFDVALVRVVVHGWWLPSHGVSGWTAEPRERYYALLGLGPDGRPR